MPLFPEQCRAARGLLNWTQHHLASFAGVSRSTIKDFECHRHALHRSSERLVVETFENHGVHFLVDEADGVGLRLIQRAGQSGSAAHRDAHERAMLHQNVLPEQ